MRVRAGSARRLVLLVGALAVGANAAAEIRLPTMIGDHAVLQRERPIHLWGWATPGAKITAGFRGGTVAAMADRLGQWSLYLAPEKAGGPYTLTLNGDGSQITLNDVLVGDVWFASGQSNMEFPLQGFGATMPLKNQTQEIAAATHPRLRLLRVEKKSAAYPLDEATGVWTECTPATAKNFSAVAYFFGREISAKQDVPVGLVDSSWGGTPADSWVSLDTLGTDAQLLPAFAARAKFAKGIAEADAEKAASAREDAAATAAGKPAPPHPWRADPESWLPAGLYNGMIAPFTPMTIKGFLWYQGETNSGPGRAAYYRTLFPALIGDWRSHFAQGDLPFLYVQISSFESPGEDWGLVRDAQRRTLYVADTAMATTLDLGEPHNVHPADKQDVGARLALAARSMVYGECVEDSGPLFREATTELQKDGSTAMRVWFEHGKGLTYHGKAATGFELAGADHKFVPAEAAVEGDTVLVKTAALPGPVYVRFGWASVVTDSLFNAAGLPAPTFTSEPNPVR